jgi:hypothetical protein
MTATQTGDKLVQWAAWELQRYQVALPPNQRSIRKKLVDSVPDLTAKKEKKQTVLNRMYDFMATPEKWNTLDPMVQDDRWQQFHRTLKEYEQVCDCLHGIEALKRP